MTRTALATAALLLAAALAACDRSSPDATTPDPPAGPPWFAEEAAARGVDFTWRSGHREMYYNPESIGAGAALFDFDGDGDLDLYAVQAGDITAPPAERPPNRLFRNRGDGVFDDVTEGSGADHRGYGMGAACGDYDGDGDVDLYVTNVGPNVLLRNDGGGRFTDVTAATGTGNADWGSSAVFVDYDGDRDLDLFVLNYINWSVSTETVCYNALGIPDYCLPANYNAPGRDVLYRNEGDGSFTDVTDAAGMAGAAATGLGVVSGDFNGDGWPDLFVANDGMPDHLWFNRRDGTFIEFGMTFGAALDQEGKAKAGMGVAAADLDDDLDLDLIVCNLRYESDSLFLNESGRYMVDATNRAGLGVATRSFTRFGQGLVDFDNDGRLDLYQANGRVFRTAERFSGDEYAEPNMLLRGAAGPRFESVSPRGGTAPELEHTSRGAAFGDLDNDGGVDVVVINRDAPAYVLRNVVPDRGHWIALRVLDARGGDAIGAIVDVTVGERTLRREVRPAYSYMSSNDPRVHFGLGRDGVPTTVTAVVRRPDGTVQRVEGLPIDGVRVIGPASRDRSAAPGS